MNFLLPLFFHVVSSSLAGCIQHSNNNTYDFSALNGTYVYVTLQFNYTFAFCGVLLGCGASNATLCQASRTEVAEASLGRWDNTTAWTSTDYGVESIFKNGDLCQQKLRRTSVVYTCQESATDAEILNVTETVPCEYSVQINVPQSVCGGVAPTLSPTPGNVTVSPTPANVTLSPTSSNITLAPTPVSNVTASPTSNATFAPTPANMTVSPTPANVTVSPTPANMTLAPTPTNVTLAPTSNVTLAPTIPANTSSPTSPTTEAPSAAPTTGSPTSPTQPTTNAPTLSPTSTVVTKTPTRKTQAPSAVPVPPPSGGLSTGAIVGIVLGGVAVIGAVAYCLMSRPASRPAYQPLGGGA